MDSTFLLHKPVVYGSAITNNLFLTVLLVHIVAAAIAPVAAVVALVAAKGSRTHLLSGRYFDQSMVAIALTGIVLDIVRLCFFVTENHTKYVGYSMPSTYPARLAFLFASLCVLYLLKVVKSPYRQSARKIDVLGPVSLVLTGLFLTAIIALRLNPWTGALWIVWTFILIVVSVSRTDISRTDVSREIASVENDSSAERLRHRAVQVSKHRVGMTCLAAFSWWGALQGFGPAIALKIAGNDPSTGEYLGNQPGPFSLTFFLFLIGWAPFCLLAVYLIHRFKKSHRA